MSKVKDPKLAKQGKLNIDLAEARMPVLSRLKKEFSETKPLKGVTIGCCLHVTKETAVLMRTLKAGGARVGLCGSNPLSTKDDVAAGIALEGISVYAWRGLNKDEYYWCVKQVLNLKPNILIDDGADLISTIHKNKLNIDKIYGAMEETTTGVIRLKAMEEAGQLKIPLIAVNNAKTKMLLDNVFGTGQSTIDGILRATNILLAGKAFVVCGYGNCGKGIAKRAKGMGCKVIVTETDPRKAIQALYEGYQVMSMSEAAKIGDIFVTATGDKGVIRGEHIKLMKSGAILANSGHFNVEIALEDLKALSDSQKVIRPNLEEYRVNGKSIFLLAEGRLVNLVAAEGHPSEVMQTSFGNQALCVKYIVSNKAKLKPKVYEVPVEIDKRVAELALLSYGIKIDKLTPEQAKYLKAWESGT